MSRFPGSRLLGSQALDSQALWHSGAQALRFSGSQALRLSGSQVPGSRLQAPGSRLSDRHFVAVCGPCWKLVSAGPSGLHITVP